MCIVAAAAVCMYIMCMSVNRFKYRLGRGASSFLFLIGLLTSSCRAVASFDLYDDDNGPGSEPPPHAQTGSHPLRSVASGGGKPSFACFSSQSRVLSM